MKCDARDFEKAGPFGHLAPGMNERAGDVARFEVVAARLCYRLPCHYEVTSRGDKVAPSGMAIFSPARRQHRAQMRASDGLAVGGECDRARNFVPQLAHIAAPVETH